MSSPFDRPAPAGDNFDCRTHVGALLVIEPQSLEVAVQTVNGPADAIRCNVYVITPPGQVAEEYRNTLLFQKLLTSRLRQSIGRKVLGILTGQPGVTRDGKSVPYDLADPPDAAFDAAGRAMAQHAMAAPQQPADPWAAQQAPPGWGEPAPQQQAPQAGPWGSPQQQPPAQPAAPWGQQQQPAAAPPPGQWGAPAAPGPQPGDERPPWETDQPATPWGQQ